MTLQEMGGAYRDQAEVLRERIRALRTVCRQEESGELRFLFHVDLLVDRSGRRLRWKHNISPRGRVNRFSSNPAHRL